MILRQWLVRSLMVIALFSACVMPLILPHQALAQAARKELLDTVPERGPEAGLEAVRRLAEQIKAERTETPAEDTALSEDEFEQLRNTVEKQFSQQGPGFANGLRFSATPELQAELGEVVYREYFRTLDHNYELFRWQLFSTRISFAMTILLVLCGVIFSAMQFWKSFRAAEAGEPTPTELELSGGRVKVSSPVLGVVILVISLAFFYLFMLHAYPIEDVRPKNEVTKAAD